MKKAKWIVDVKTSLLSDEEVTEFEEGMEDGVELYEISAIKDDNEQGFRSLGWSAADVKIILFSEDHNPLTDEDIVPEERIEWAKKVTQGFCDLLNKMEADK